MLNNQDWITRKDRLPVDIDAVVHRAEGGRTPVRLSDFSEHGCRIESAAHFTIGEQVEIQVPRMGVVRAQIRWALPGSAGARFLTDSPV